MPSAGPRVTKESRFATKPELAARMLARAFDAGVPAGWVTGDSVYGSAKRLRMFLEERRQPFVLAVTGDEALWTGLPGRGPEQVRARTIAEGLGPNEWARLSAGSGSKGERLFDWALVPLERLRLGEEERRWGHWLLVRRSIAESEELAFYVAFAPREGTTIGGLVRVAGARWRIEACFEQAKGGFGLDEYEVHRWEAWHRHVTFSLLAHAFVAVVGSREAEKGGLPAGCCA